MFNRDLHLSERSHSFADEDYPVPSPLRPPRELLDIEEEDAVERELSFYAVEGVESLEELARKEKVRSP